MIKRGATSPCRHFRWRLSCLAVGLLLAGALGAVAPLAAQTPPPNRATIQGQVVNGTAGMAAPPNLPITLYALDAGLETVIFTRTTTADANGLARFDELDPTLDALYTLVADYRGAIYFSEPQRLPATQLTLTLPLTVYESTSDASVIHIDQLHLILDVRQDSLLIEQVWVVSNTSDRTFSNEDGTSLFIAVPASASDVRFDSNEPFARYAPVPNGFADTEAVRPGYRSHQILFSFVLPYDGQSLDVTIPLAYPAQNINLLMPDVGVRLSSNQLAAAGVRQAQGMTYLVFSAQALAAGQTLSFRLSGPAPATAYHNSLWAIGGVILAMIAVITGALVWRRQARQASAAREKERLLDEIAALDDAYEAGEIAPLAYQAQREKLKGRLIEMIKRG